MRKSGAIFLFILLGLFLPIFIGRLNRNFEGLRAMKMCAGVMELRSLNWPFFQGGVARCMANEERMRLAYRVAVQEPNARLDILRSAMPFDLEVAQAAVETHSDQAQAFFWLGEAMVISLEADLQEAARTGKPPSPAVFEAITVYERGLALDPTNGDEWDHLGRLYLAVGEWEQAIKAFDLACHYVDQGKNGCPSAAILYLRHGMVEQAILRYEETLKQLPGYLPALHGLVDAWISLGRPEQAIPYLEMLTDQGDAEAQALLEQLRGLP